MMTTEGEDDDPRCLMEGGMLPSLSGRTGWHG